MGRFGRGCVGTAKRFALGEEGAGAVDGPDQPGRIGRLHQIIDRGDFKGGDRELVERGDEHHRRRAVEPRQRASHFDPVEAGHGDVEQDEVRRKLLGLANGLLAIVCGAGEADPLDPADQQRKALGGEGLVIGDENAERLVSHCLGSGSRSKLGSRRRRGRSGSRRGRHNGLRAVGRRWRGQARCLRARGPRRGPLGQPGRGD